MAFDTFCSQAALAVLAEPSGGSTACASSSSRSCGQCFSVLSHAVSQDFQLGGSPPPACWMAKGFPFILFHSGGQSPVEYTRPFLANLMVCCKHQRSVRCCFAKWWLFGSNEVSRLQDDAFLIQTTVWESCDECQELLVWISAVCVNTWVF